MASEVKAKFGSSTVLISTALDSLAHSTVGAGKQSALVDNSSVKALLVHIYWVITTNASLAPADQGPLHFFLIKGDGTNRTFGAGASEASITIPPNRRRIHFRTVTTALQASYFGDFTIYNPGQEWGLAFYQATGQALHTTGNSIRYVVETEERP